MSEKNFVIVNSNGEYWSGSEWGSITEAYIHSEFRREYMAAWNRMPVDGAWQEIYYYGEYLSSKKTLSRIENLAEEIFGNKKPRIELSEGDYFDPSIEIENISIYWNDSTRVPEENPDPVLVPAYQVATINYDPGVRYHRDGSGTPPSVDVNDVGKPHKRLDDAIIEAFKLWTESRLHDYFEYEADMELARIEEEMEADRYDRMDK